ncbi:RcnB family protein [Alloalcanivorax sp. C16-2]|uniref:RcnB family protein n=1 Tax=Alloalcanivorax sp. C16-2 TaxID=3390052 RepID=UPI003970BF39
MNARTRNLLILCLSLGSLTTAWAGPRPGDEPDHRGNAAPEHHQAAPEARPAPAASKRDPAGWHQGDRLPEAYRGDRHVVDDWRHHDLPAPGKDRRWIKVDNDFVLIAITTGVIVSVIGVH